MMYVYNFNILKTAAVYFANFLVAKKIRFHTKSICARGSGGILVNLVGVDVAQRRLDSHVERAQF